MRCSMLFSKFDQIMTSLFTFNKQFSLNFSRTRAIELTRDHVHHLSVERGVFTFPPAGAGRRLRSADGRNECGHWSFATRFVEPVKPTAVRATEFEASEPMSKLLKSFAKVIKSK